MKRAEASADVFNMIPCNLAPCIPDSRMQSSQTTGLYPHMWCGRQDPYPHYVAPGTGPHPMCARDRTQSPLLGTLDDDEDEADDDKSLFGFRLGQSSIAAARSIPGMCV